MKSTISTISILTLILFPVLLFGQDKPPIIDMHLHTSFPGIDKNPDLALPRFCFPVPCEQAPGIARSRDEILKLTIEEMDRNNIVLGFVSSSLNDIHRWKNVSPGTCSRKP